MVLYSGVILVKQTPKGAIKYFLKVEPHFHTIAGNILYAEIGSNSQLFLIFLTEPQKKGLMFLKDNAKIQHLR